MLTPFACAGAKTNPFCALRNVVFEASSNGSAGSFLPKSSGPGATLERLHSGG
jgi:hypothetical protein